MLSGLDSLACSQLTTNQLLDFTKEQWDALPSYCQYLRIQYLSNCDVDLSAWSLNKLGTLTAPQCSVLCTAMITPLSIDQLNALARACVISLPAGVCDALSTETLNAWTDAQYLTDADSCAGLGVGPGSAPPPLATPSPDVAIPPPDAMPPPADSWVPPPVTFGVPPPDISQAPTSDGADDDINANTDLDDDDAGEATLAASPPPPLRVSILSGCTPPVCPSMPRQRCEAMYTSPDAQGCATSCSVDCSMVPCTITASVRVQGVVVDTFDRVAFAAAVAELLGIDINRVRVISVTAASTGARRLASGAADVSFEVTGAAAESVAADIVETLQSDDTPATLATGFSQQLVQRYPDVPPAEISLALIGDPSVVLEEDSPENAVPNPFATSPPPPPGGSPNLLVPIVAAVAAIMVVGGGAFVVLRGRGRPDREAKNAPRSAAPESHPHAAGGAMAEAGASEAAPAAMTVNPLLGGGKLGLTFNEEYGYHDYADNA